MPAATPVIRPETATVTTATLLLAHKPPNVASVSIDEEPAHTVSGPLIGSIDEPTVITFVATAVPQLLVTAYEIITVPADKPVTTPEDDTVALVLLALQVPPLMASVSVMEAATATIEAPLMLPADAAGLTVTIFVAVAVPQLPETV